MVAGRDFRLPDPSVLPDSALLLRPSQCNHISPPPLTQSVLFRKYSELGTLHLGFFGIDTLGGLRSSLHILQDTAQIAHCQKMRDKAGLPSRGARYGMQSSAGP